MIDRNSRLMILVVTGAAFAGLVAAWVSGLANTALAGLSDTLGFLAVVLFVLAVLVASWLSIEAHRDESV